MVQLSSAPALLVLSCFAVQINTRSEVILICKQNKDVGTLAAILLVISEC